MTRDLEMYSYLWDGTQSGWKLAREKEFPDDIFIINHENGTFLLVDDPSLKKRLLERMLRAGMEIEEET